MSEFEPLDYADGRLALRGLMARPTAMPRAAIAVFPTIMNTTPAVQAKARALAAVGYLALIADFYGDRPTDFAEASAWADALREDPGRHRTRLNAAVEALREAAPGLPLAAIGFCMGGQAVLELARDGADLALVASFHGLLDTKAPAQPGAVKARILVCHGDADPLAPRSHVLAFWEEMDRAGADWHFHSYAGVKHGFTNPDAPEGNTALAYDASADRQSWAALMELLAEALGESS